MGRFTNHRKNTLVAHTAKKGPVQSPSDVSSTLIYPPCYWYMYAATGIYMLCYRYL